jgi:TonB family protein
VGLATIERRVVSGVLALWLAAAGVALLCPAKARAQEPAKTTVELSRKVKVKVEPVYPDVARRMSIVGTVRLAVVVAPNGTVKSSKPVGGHPLLISAAMEAIKRWKFEPAATESSGIVEFKFQPQN